MAFTTEFTQAQVTQLTSSISLGVLELTHNGKTTKFQSIAQMLALRDRMKAELAAAAAPAVRPCMTRPTIFLRD